MAERSLILYVKDEPIVNDDFKKHKGLPSLEAVVKATDGEVVLSFVPGRLPNSSNPYQKIKLSQGVTDYLAELILENNLELGQLGVYHYCPECAKPGKDLHSHEQFLRHGTGEDDFFNNLKKKREDIKKTFGKYPSVFTSPQNWMHTHYKTLNTAAVKFIDEFFDILVLTHPAKEKNFGFQTSKIKSPGHYKTSYKKSLKILPTIDLNGINPGEKEESQSFYVHYDELSSNLYKVMGIRKGLIKPTELFYPDELSCEDLGKDVKRTGRLRKFKEFL